MQYLNVFIISIIGVFGTATAGTIIVSIKWILSIKKNVDKMIIHGEKRACESQIQFQMLRAHGKAIKTLLEVNARNQNNGNVEEAFTELRGAESYYENYYDTLVKS